MSSVEKGGSVDIFAGSGANGGDINIRSGSTTSNSPGSIRFFWAVPLNQVIYSWVPRLARRSS